MIPEAPSPIYPDQVGRIILQGMTEVIGTAGVNAVLNMAGLSSFIDKLAEAEDSIPMLQSDLQYIQHTLEELYGPRGGRGLAMQIGRACFYYGLKQYEDRLGFSDSVYRLLPQHKRIQSGLERAARLMNEICFMDIEQSEDDQFYYWRARNSAQAVSRRLGGPTCSMMVGLLQEFLAWNSSGKYYFVNEVECRANGALTCLFSIDKKPLD